MSSCRLWINFSCVIIASTWRFVTRKRRGLETFLRIFTNRTPCKSHSSKCGHRLLRLAIRIPSSSARSSSGTPGSRPARTGIGLGSNAAAGRLSVWETKIRESARRRSRPRFSPRLRPDANAKITTLLRREHRRADSRLRYGVRIGALTPSPAQPTLVSTMTRAGSPMRACCCCCYCGRARVRCSTGIG